MAQRFHDFKQLSVMRIAHEVENWNSVFQLISEGVDIVVDDKNVVEAYLTFENVEIFDNESVLPVLEQSCVLIIETVVNKPLLWVDTVNDFFGK
jgi:hypothetical protein